MKKKWELALRGLKGQPPQERFFLAAAAPAWYNKENARKRGKTDIWSLQEVSYGSDIAADC
ncbi:MAG TPA: hypothetical protein IAA57_01995 [Candidatus Pullilachnospira intestinigallinarum]|nr:hypothetical protein [Candidatus Pullilachnospira intestinigallinarum]